MSRFATIPCLLVPLWLVPTGQALAQEEPPDPVALLYGGPGSDEAAAAEAHKQLEELPEPPAVIPAEWFLQSVVPVTQGIYLLGKNEITHCTGTPVALDGFKAAAERAYALWDDLEFEDAHTAFRQAEAMLGCLTEVLDSRELGRFHFARAVAGHFQRPRDAQYVRDAFSDAHRTRPNMAWDPDYSYEPQKYFYESRDVLLRGGRVMIWSTRPSGSVYINGRAVDDSYVGNELLGGRNLLQIKHGDKVLTAWVRFGPAARIVLGGVDELWEVVTDTPSGPALDRSIAARLGLGYAVAQDYWLATTVGPGAVDAATGAVVYAEGYGPGSFRPVAVVEFGGGYLFHLADQVQNLETPSPTDHWMHPRVGVGLRFLPYLGVQLGAGAAFTAPTEVQDGRYTRYMLTGNIGLAIEQPRGKLKPGARLEAALAFPGNLLVDRNQDFVDDTGTDVLAGATAAFTLAGRLAGPMWIQGEIGGGWVGSWTGSAQVRFQWRQR
jgi:hypothetical protein